MPTELELARIIITEMNDQQVLILREKEGEKREFPIIIGIFEATTIDRRVKGVTSPRPLTHDLLANSIEMLGGRIKDVLIHQMEHQTFYATLRVEKNGELIEIDARPSDCIAIAVSFSPWLPILIDEEILEMAIAQEN